MHIRKRRFLAGVLALSLALGMMSPTAAWAAETPSDSGAVTSGQSVQKSEEPTATPSDASEPEETETPSTEEEPVVPPSDTSEPEETETPPTEQEPVCICEAPCSEGEMNGDCPVCGAEGATPETCGQYEAQEEEGSTSGQNVQKPEEPVATPSDALEPGETETPPTEQEAGVMTVTAFEPLAAEVARQTVPQLVEGGETVDPVLPDTLSASGYTGIQDSGEAEAITIEGVTWTAQPDYNPATAAEYSFTPALPEGYALAAGLEFPVIVVTVLAADNALVPLAEVEEQFENVEPGETYWFDLSGMDILGTPNGGLPDGSRHWVPFTYTGTINAYVLNQNSNWNTWASQSASETTEPSGTYGYTYDHSLFIADYAVTYSVSWDELNSKSMIFGTDYQSGGVDYTLRAPSVGSNYTGSGDSGRGTPQNNEWDVILDKNSDYIRNWNGLYFHGQDTYTEDSSVRVIRGYTSARNWDRGTLSYQSADIGFRPVLEILNAGTLSSDGLSVVAVDLNGGKIGATGGSVNIVVKSGADFTAPSGEGLTVPVNGAEFVGWKADNNTDYEVGASVPSTVTTLTAQWKYPAESTPAITIDYKNETLTGFEDGASYTINGESVSLDAGGTFALDSSWFGKSLSIVKKGDSFTTSDSAPQTLTIPARPAAPAVAINYTAETLSTTSGLEWTSGQSVQRWESCSENMAATAFSWDGSAEVTVHFRTPATESAFASAEQELLILARPKAPTGLQGKNETYSGDHDGKITGVSSAMEYQKDGTASWEDCAGEEITGLAPGTYLVRLKATGNAFAGFAASVEIKTGAKRTYTLNVTAPTFEPVSYGYAQPDAAPLTIQSSGNSAATISKVEADSKNFVIGGSGSTVAAGGSINTWTIRPVAGLEADTYKATVTVTYTGGATATAQVSFTVNPAEQAAPSAPALDSRDKHQITLKAVPDNQNGAKAEYSKDGGASWQDSPIFTGLSSGTTYSFIVRYGATADGNYKPSPASPAAEYSTKSSGGSGGGGGGGSSYDYYTISASAGEGGSISPSGSLTIREGRDKTYTITPDSGYHISDVLVDGKSVGAVSTYTFDNVRKQHTIEAVFAKDNPGTGVDNPFTDVHPEDWFFNDVMFVYGNGLMSGTSATTFAPYANTTRAQLAVIFWRLDGSPAVEGRNSFTDVPYGPGTAWYYDAVTWAQQKGIVAGYEDGTFHPGDPVTREQLAMMFYNYAKYKGYGITAKDDLSGFTDAGEISGWALDAMKWAVGSGLISGKGNGILDPKGTATRAEVAAMLHNFIEKNHLVPPVAPGGDGGTGGNSGGGWTQHVPSPQTGDNTPSGRL